MELSLLRVLPGDIRTMMLNALFVLAATNSLGDNFDNFRPVPMDIDQSSVGGQATIAHVAFELFFVNCVNSGCSRGTKFLGADRFRLGAAARKGRYGGSFFICPVC